jgi:tripartite-type tricarboxylate transporter receptor subunit TctC
MNTQRRRWLKHSTLLGAALCTAGLPLAASAQAYPSKPIRIVVAFAVGGALDTVARVVGARMAEQMGNPVVVENKPGANGNIGMEHVAKSAPDGYTLLLAAPGLATNPALYKDLGYQTRDFVPVAKVAYAPQVLVVHPASPAKTVQELLALGKTANANLSYGSAGNGASGHLASELLKGTTKIDALHVPYKGGAPALTDLMGGRLSFMLINPVEAVPHVRGHRIRALAVAADKRIALLPETPTFAEGGVPFEASVWWGFVMPAKTPKEIVDRLSAEILKAVNDEAVRERLVSLGAVVDPQSGEQFGRFVNAEVEKWAGIVKSAGISAQ